MITPVNLSRLGPRLPSYQTLVHGRWMLRSRSTVDWRWRQQRCWLECMERPFVQPHPLSRSGSASRSARFRFAHALYGRFRLIRRRQAIDAKLWFRILFGQASVYTASCFSAGGIAALVGLSIDRGFWPWFVAGSAVPWGLLVLYFGSHKVMREELVKWDSLYADGMITQRQHQHYRQAVISWYMERWYGESRLAPQDNERTT
jgi:hypothetical protein